VASGLCFRPDGTFTIAQLTDLHWHDGGPADIATAALVARVLDLERPDLVVFTGDIIAGHGCADPADALRRAVAPAVERCLPWTLVFGNHDDEGALDRRALLKVARGEPGCLAQAGPARVWGVGNHRLRIGASCGGSPAAQLYFLDSGGYAATSVGGYDWIRQEQVAWYLRVSRASAVEAGRVLPALAFLHIPLPEFDEVWDTQPCSGSKHEAVCCPRVNSGLFAALHERGEVVGVFVGHDHVNDYTGVLHGIRLCYGRASGYGTYGREGMPRGARLVRLTEGARTFDTWLRLDDGSAVRRQREHPPAGRVLSA
jgi:hypothetical protein